jgi:hypothetical protein
MSSRVSEERTNPKRGKGLKVNVILLAVTCALSFLVLEAVFRAKAYYDDRLLFDRVFSEPVEIPEDGQAKLGHIIRPSKNRKIVYELKPDISVTYIDARMTTNSEGFRDREYEVDKDEGTVRVVGIGDSMMFGYGLPDGKDYLTLLESKLPERYAARKWEAINTSVPSYNAVNEIETLRAKGLRYGPDIVICGFYWNDFELPPFLRKQEDYFSLGKSFLIEYVARVLGKKEKGLWEEGAFSNAPIISVGGRVELDTSKVPEKYLDLVGWDSVIGAMNELRQMSLEHGFDVIFVFTNINQMQQMITLPIIRKASELGFHTIDVWQAVRMNAKARGLPEAELYVSMADGHPSEVASELISQELLEYMEEAGIIERRLRP